MAMQTLGALACKSFDTAQSWELETSCPVSGPPKRAMEPDSIAQQKPTGVSAEERGEVARITRDAWRELGFWYECDMANRSWKVRADRRGIMELAEIVRSFLSSAAAADVGEHLHLGPFANLRVIRSDRPLISWRGIAGAPSDLKQFVAELEAIATTLATNSTAERVPPYELGSAFGHDDGFRFIVQPEPEGFDPAGADPTLGAVAPS